MSAVFSSCGLHRHRLDRDCGLPFEGSLVFAYFGINPSTAGVVKNDPTVNKWLGFTKLNNGHRLIAGNVFSYRTSKVKELAALGDTARGPEYWHYINQIIQDADVLVPCWGGQEKVPKNMRGAPFQSLLDALLQSGKPVLHFGLTQAGDPLHALFLGYDTPLLPFPADNRGRA